MTTPPKVFISYSWDGENHQNWVLNLANQLVANGVDVILDQYELQLGRNLSHFMEKAVSEADKVLLILTENYKKKAEGRTGGVGYEYSMINSALYKTQTNNKKFLPILRGADRDNSTPIFVDAFINLDMRSDNGFEQQLETLLRTIFNQPKITKPPLGKRPDFGTTLPTTQTDTVSTTNNAGIADQINTANQKHQANKELQAKKQAIKNLIARAQTGKAIDALLTLAKALDDEEVVNTVTLISAQHAQYKKEVRLNLSTNEQQGIALAKINNGLLGILEDLG